jgi:hypothetical protein
LLEAVQLGDALVRRQNRRVAPEQLTACAGAVGRASGARLVRQAHRLIRPGTDSLMETWLRLVVWDAGFPDPEVNWVIGIDGRRRYLDLAWPAQKVGLEYHGRQHFDQSSQAFDDMVRRGELQQAGWTLVEAAFQDLREPLAVLVRLAKALNA